MLRGMMLMLGVVLIVVGFLAETIPKIPYVGQLPVISDLSVHALLLIGAGIFMTVMGFSKSLIGAVVITFAVIIILKLFGGM